MSKVDAPSMVQLKDSETGYIVYIKQKDCDVAHKTLGAIETPSRDYRAEVKWLKDKARSIAQRISTASLSASEARSIYGSMYIPSISYSSPAGV